MSTHRAARPILLDGIERYYSDRLRQHGPTPRGVDWNSAESQQLRFAKLLTVVEDDRCRLIDYGCGYGALLTCVRARGSALEYVGFDVSRPMIAAASHSHAHTEGATFTCEPEALSPADYVVASGIFNVRLEHAEDVWAEYVRDTLQTIAGLAVRGFAFNMLTAYADADKRRPDLYYVDPIAMFEWCRATFGRRLALLHDYPLYEFTIVVRR